MEYFKEFYEYIMTMDIDSFSGFYEWFMAGPLSVQVTMAVVILGFLVALWVIIHGTFTPFD